LKRGGILGIRKFLREYYGVIPVLGGTVVAGVTGIIAYSIGVAQGLTKEVQYILTTQDVGRFLVLYEYGSSVAGKYIVPGFMVGQALTYKLKKSLFSIFEKRR